MTPDDYSSMQQEMSNGLVHELTPQQLQDISDALDAMMESPLFSKSRRYPALLKYIVGESIRGHQEDLKERIIGARLFGRPADYDTASDPVVRVVLNELRKRLSIYNAEHTDLPVQIHLPIGHYQAQFMFSDKTDELADPSEEALETSELSELESVHAEHIPQLPDIELAAVPAHSRGNARSLLFYACVVILVLSSAAGAFYIRWKQLHQYRDMWQTILSYKRVEPLMVVGMASNPTTPFPLAGDNLANTPSTSGQHFEKHKVGLGITMAVADIATYFGAEHRSYKILSADKAYMTDLHGSPIILIGDSHNNPWIQELQGPLRYQIVASPDGGMQISDRKSSGRTTNWNASYEGDTLFVSTDYSIIACYESSVTDSPVVMIAGLNGFGVGTAGSVITSSDMIHTITSMAPKGWKGWQFEAIIRTDVVQSHPGHVQIVATSFW